MATLEMEMVLAEWWRGRLDANSQLTDKIEYTNLWDYEIKFMGGQWCQWVARDALYLDFVLFAEKSGFSISEPQGCFIGCFKRMAGVGPTKMRVVFGNLDTYNSKSQYRSVFIFKTLPEYIRNYDLWTKHAARSFI